MHADRARFHGFEPPPPPLRSCLSLLALPAAVLQILCAMMRLETLGVFEATARGAGEPIRMAAEVTPMACTQKPLDDEFNNTRLAVRRSCAGRGERRPLCGGGGPCLRQYGPRPVPNSHNVHLLVDPPEASSRGLPEASSRGLPEASSRGLPEASSRGRGRCASRS